MRTGDTVVALSSGALPSGVAVIRLSGPEAGSVLTEMLGALPEPRRLVLADIALSGAVLDRGLVAWMPGPRSFTGEDCVELHLHGSPAVVRATLRALTARPEVRLAEPGEFTRRAFENGKLDLTEAQGLGDLIDAETENQRALAHLRLTGGLTRQIDIWRNTLLDLRAEIEAQLDFSDEGDVGALPAHFLTAVAGLRADMAMAMASGRQGRIIRDGYRVVLAGPPNAGKSSLLNALSRSDAAIVSDEPGTTRDLKEVPLDLKGQLVILIDSAGLRETSSKAEAIGIARARDAMLTADHILWLQAPDTLVTAPPLDLTPEAGPAPKLDIVGTKADLGPIEGADILVSSTTGHGIEALLHRLHEASGAAGVRAANLLVSHERDQLALNAAVESLDAVEGHIAELELAAEDLRRASMALERLLGRIDAESVLDRLFSSFCIGK